MVRRLIVGPGLQLPLQWMTGSSVVYGTRGSGKSTLGRKLAEEVANQGQRFCAIDPTGAWWGLKSTESGTDVGLPVVIFGGDHADVPLEPGAGAQLADIVAEIDQSVILDLELLSKGKQIVFIGAFLERLYHINREPLLLLMDEAQRYAPQKPMSPDATKTLGATEDIVKLGRKHGLGSVVFTQRGSGLNKEVSELGDVLIAFRTPGVLDQGRIKDWLEANATADQMREVMGSISGLPTGTAIFASNHPDLRLFGTYAIDRPKTFDSSATPQVGQKRREPRVLSKPDLEALSSRMAVAIERAKADDPKELKRRIAELERDDPRLDGTEGAHPAWWRGSDYGYRKGLADAKPVTVEKIVEKPVITEEHIRALETAWVSLSGSKADLEDIVETVVDLVKIARAGVEPVAELPSSPVETRRVVGSTPTPSTIPREAQRMANFADRIGLDLSGVKLTSAERRFLAVLGTYGPMSRERLAMLAGYKITSGHISNTLSLLRTKGLVEGAKEICATAVGLALAADSIETLPKPGPELVAHWMPKLNKAEQQFLTVIVAAHPNAISGAEIAERTGYKPTSGHISNTLSLLRTKGLIEGPTSGVVAAAALVG